jgi:hypothetical protein
MSREVKRVPLDFDWPLDQDWEGYLSPASHEEVKCIDCDGSGGSWMANRLQAQWYGNAPFDPAETGSTAYDEFTPAVRAFAERNVAHSPGYYGIGEGNILREGRRLAKLFNGQWSHHLRQEDVDALVAKDRLMDFTHTWTREDRWQPRDPMPVITAEQVNTWSIGPGLGHDSINCWVVVKAACERAGHESQCARCEGHGTTERYPGQRAEAEAWKQTDPPTGDGWQLWQTVSEGAPISPVFSTAEGLASWMAAGGNGGRTYTFQQALKWIQDDGWAPSLIAGPGMGVVDGITGLIAMHGYEEA